MYCSINCRFWFAPVLILLLGFPAHADYVRFDLHNTATGSMRSKAIYYRTWDSTVWQASLTPNGIFIHTSLQTGETHESDRIDYVTEDGSTWSARFQNDSFLHAPGGNWNEAHRSDYIIYRDRFYRAVTARLVFPVARSQEKFRFSLYPPFIEPGDNDSTYRTAIRYKTWDGSVWDSSLDYTGMFHHRSLASGSEHSSRTLNFLNWNHQPWQARFSKTGVFHVTGPGIDDDTLTLSYINADGNPWIADLGVGRFDIIDQATETTQLDVLDWYSRIHTIRIRSDGIFLNDNSRPLGSPFRKVFAQAFLPYQTWDGSNWIATWRGDNQILHTPRDNHVGNSSSIIRYRGIAGATKEAAIHHSGLIDTTAGNGTRGYCGDGGPAIDACLNSTAGLDIDGEGNIYIADRFNNRIRKVNPEGFITTVAGNGLADYCGDGGPAIKACLNNPVDVEIGKDGSLYIADLQNHRIRKLAPDGTITTVAGNGTYGYCGDGGPATEACLQFPEDVELSAGGKLYIADAGNHRIRAVVAAGIVSTVAGNGSAGFCGDGGPATAACLNFPEGIDVADDGDLFIADTRNSRIRTVNPGGTISTLAGIGAGGFGGDGGPAKKAQLYFPSDIDFDPGDGLYISDRGNFRIRKIDSVGIINTVAGNGTFAFCGDGKLAVDACFRSPNGVSVAANGRFFVADMNNNRIREVSPVVNGN